MKNVIKRYACMAASIITGTMMVFWIVQIIRILLDIEGRNRLYIEVAGLQIISWINVAFVVLCLLVGTLVFKISSEALPWLHWDDYKSDIARKIAGIIHYSVGVLFIIVPIPLIIICMTLTPHPSEYVSLYGAACIEYEPVDDLLHSSSWLAGVNSWICFLAYHSSRYFKRMRAVETGVVEEFDEFKKETIRVQQLLNERATYTDRENRYTLEVIPEYDCGVMKISGSDVTLAVHFFKGRETISICKFYEDNVDYYPQSENEWFGHGDFACVGEGLELDINDIKEANTVLRKEIIRLYKNGEKI